MKDPSAAERARGGALGGSVDSEAAARPDGVVARAAPRPR